MRLEQAYQLLAGRHHLAIKNAPLALGEDALDQRPIVAELGAPALGRGPSEVGQPFAGLVQRCLGGTGGGNQLPIEPAPLGFAAAYSIARARFLARRRRSRHCSAGAPGTPAACRKSRVMTRTASHNSACRSAHASVPR